MKHQFTMQRVTALHLGHSAAFMAENGGWRIDSWHPCPHDVEFIYVLWRRKADG